MLNFSDPKNSFKLQDKMLQANNLVIKLRSGTSAY